MKRKLIKKNKNKYSKLYKLAQDNCMGLSCVIALMGVTAHRNKVRRWERKGTEVLGEPEDFLRGRRKKQKMYIKVRGKLKDTETFRLVPKD